MDCCSRSRGTAFTIRWTGGERLEMTGRRRRTLGAFLRTEDDADAEHEDLHVEAEAADQAAGE